VDCKRTPSTNGFGPMETMEEEDDDSPAPMPRTNSQNSFSFSNNNIFNFNSGSSSTPTGLIGGPQGDGDALMNDDTWLSMDLDSLLAQSLPPIDMSLYQSMGDLAPIHSDTVPYGQDDFSSYLYPSINMDTGASSSTAQSNLTTRNGSISLGSSFSTPVTQQVRAVLSDFCESQFQLPLSSLVSSSPRPCSDKSGLRRGRQRPHLLSDGAPMYFEGAF
jgi:hypothetical protein